MSQGLPLEPERFTEAVLDFGWTLFRLELQDSYAEPEEDDLYAAFLRGEATTTAGVPELVSWYQEIAAAVRAGKQVQRVRVQRQPPTDYQRFERWLDRWNIAAGEDIRYLTTRQAYATGLLPAADRFVIGINAAAGPDWWLQDSSRLIVMQFDSQGRRTSNEIITDPKIVIQACKWRDLAVHYAARAHNPGAAA